MFELYKNKVENQFNKMIKVKNMKHHLMIFFFFLKWYYPQPLIHHNKTTLWNVKNSIKINYEYHVDKIMSNSKHARLGNYNCQSYT